VSLIILGGLPGTGKTTIAREIARQLAAVHVRIDSIEDAIRESGALNPMDDSGYRIGYRIAEDNLRVGRTVIADSVNPIPITRDAWLEVARRAQVDAIEIEVTCSDLDEHRRRVESRFSESPVTWQQVIARDYRPWTRERIVIDTANSSIEEIVCQAIFRIGSAQR
jgi:predicted kinase